MSLSSVSSDAMPQYQRSFIPPDMAGVSDSIPRSNFPLTDNCCTVLLSSYILDNLLMNISITIYKNSATDLAIVFRLNSAFRTIIGSAAHAFSAIITVVL
ncbi:hypothetical protein MPH_12797 [Macrophomina phaseolina MS6]|uniref:Uncharacterized protein n=1 Tax=Macrophomina phaseolina (strain MS6) TaxID=1126212 RepID=K2RBF6_MACPH|nr:hypothetical protein MPH_12797 [Macrophomina phaseolina MS6]